eukprot:scaffold596_cov87-Cylindrotheca_fusiformis.AAC.5
MGGHSAWRKRVAAGGLAKEGSGGAIARHRPRWGRKGKDLKLNRKGNIAGRGNPKKKKKKSSFQQQQESETNIESSSHVRVPFSATASSSTIDRLKQILLLATAVVLATAFVAFLSINQGT